MNEEAIAGLGIFFPILVVAGILLAVLWINLRPARQSPLWPQMQAIPVSARVGRVANNDPGLVEPLPGSADKGLL